MKKTLTLMGLFVFSITLFAQNNTTKKAVKATKSNIEKHKLNELAAAYDIDMDNTLNILNDSINNAKVEVLKENVNIPPLQEDDLGKQFLSLLNENKNQEALEFAKQALLKDPSFLITTYPNPMAVRYLDTPLTAIIRRSCSEENKDLLFSKEQLQELINLDTRVLLAPSRRKTTEKNSITDTWPIYLAIEMGRYCSNKYTTMLADNAPEALTLGENPVNLAFEARLYDEAFYLAEKNRGFLSVKTLDVFFRSYFVFGYVIDLEKLKKLLDLKPSIASEKTETFIKSKYRYEEVQPGNVIITSSMRQSQIKNMSVLFCSRT